MATKSTKSVFKKVNDITVEDKEFTNKETGEIIAYKRVVLHVLLDGEADIVELVPAVAEGKSAYKVLALADDIE